MISVVYNIVLQDAASPVLGVGTENIYGDNRFQSPTLTNNSVAFNTWLSQNTNFLVDDFLNGASDYSVTAQVVNILASKPGQPPTSFPSEPFRIEVFEKTSSSFRFRFVAKTGYALSGSSLQDYNTIRVSIQIIE
jgi:hypothetical protein